MDRDVWALCEDSGPLQRVTGVAEDVPPGEWESLRFEFERGVLSLSCDIDTDEVIFETGQRHPGASDVDEAWAERLLGKHIVYAWVLQNHRGYNDGFQLRLQDNEHKEYSVQFEVAASTLHPVRVASD